MVEDDIAIEGVNKYSRDLMTTYKFSQILVRSCWVLVSDLSQIIFLFLYGYFADLFGHDFFLPTVTFHMFP